MTSVFISSNSCLISVNLLSVTVSCLNKSIFSVLACLKSLTKSRMISVFSSTSSALYVKPCCSPVSTFFVKSSMLKTKSSSFVLTKLIMSLSLSELAVVTYNSQSSLTCCLTSAISATEDAIFSNGRLLSAFKCSKLSKACIIVSNFVSLYVWKFTILFSILFRLDSSIFVVVESVD